jgi:glycosyltransferase involved in cell wall biosynthesis
VGQTFLSAREKKGRPVIGVAGAYRAEKGIDELIGLLKEKLPEFGILLGVPNPDAAAHLDVETVSTASKEEYLQMISRCDVLVFNGGKNSYFYRASGPVADAAACGTAVVVPDFPMLGKQANGIGEVFQCLENLPGAVRAAVEKVRAGQYDFDAYCNARSAQMIANQL